MDDHRIPLSADSEASPPTGSDPHLLNTARFLLGLSAILAALYFVAVALLQPQYPYLEQPSVFRFLLPLPLPAWLIAFLLCMRALSSPARPDDAVGSGSRSNTQVRIALFAHLAGLILLVLVLISVLLLP